MEKEQLNQLENEQKNTPDLTTEGVLPIEKAAATSDLTDNSLLNSTETNTQAPENQNAEEFFDATIDEEPEPQPDPVELSPESVAAIAEAKRRADHQAKVLAILSTDFDAQKRRSFRRVVALSIGSVVFLLLLAIVFFIFLRWYIAGTGVAIIAFVVAQVWLHFFKKWNYNAPISTFDDEADGIDALTTKDNELNIDNNNIDNPTLKDANPTNIDTDK